MRKESRLLRNKALASIRKAVQEYNGLNDDGRQTSVLLHTQHAFEMLLKACLCEHGVKIFDKQNGRSIGFDKCLNLCSQHIALTASEAGTLRAIDRMRDDEQHYLGGHDEGILYVHLRAAITLFDDLLLRVFNEALSDHLPERVLPISTKPPTEIELLINDKYTQIQDLLRPQRRRRDEARREIRTLLALEAHTAEAVAVSERDVDRVERGIRAGKSREDVFPRLDTLTTSVEGTGISVKVRFDKREGPPVRYISADDPREAAAVREVDLSKKYHLGRQALADVLGLNTEQTKALRWKLAMDVDDDCHHLFDHGGSSKVHCYSDNAVRRAREFMETGSITDLVADYRSAGRPN